MTGEQQIYHICLQNTPKGWFREQQDSQLNFEPWEIHRSSPSGERLLGSHVQATLARLSSLSPTTVSYSLGEAIETLEGRAVFQRNPDRLEEGVHKNLMKFKKTKITKPKSCPLKVELEIKGLGSSSAEKALGLPAGEKQIDQQPPGLNEQEQSQKIQGSDHPSCRSYLKHSVHFCTFTHPKYKKENDKEKNNFPRGEAAQRGCAVTVLGIPNGKSLEKPGLTPGWPCFEQEAELEISHLSRPEWFCDSNEIERTSNETHHTDYPQR